MLTGQAQNISHAQPIRVLLIDSQPIVLFGLSTLLEGNSGYEIVGKLDSVTYMMELLKLKQPDIVLMDLHMPGIDGLKLIKEIQIAAQGTAKVVIHTATLNETETCGLIR